MLRLTLVRHAAAEPVRVGEEDWDRALEAKGRRDAHEMGQRLRDRAFRPGSILTSPAVRALATASIMTRKMGVAAAVIRPDERLYLAAPRDMMAVVQELGGAAPHLMIFGHNPGISEFADQLSSERSLDNLPTCAVYTQEFDIAHWGQLEWASGVDADFDYPQRSG